MLFDVHAHLDLPQFDADRAAVVGRAKAAGVVVVTSALGRGGVEKTLPIIEEFDNVFACFGLPPTVFGSREIDDVVSLIRKHRKRIVGLGEVGLDYYWVKEPLKHEMQKKYFRSFVDLAKELRLPLVVHSRDAEEDVLRILGEEDACALLHCFSGSVELASEAAAAGHLISIPTSVAYSKSKQALAASVPLESLVLESDAPYLAPTPKMRNEPANVAASRDVIAKLRGTAPAAVEEATSKNARKFFDLKSNTS